MSIAPNDLHSGVFNDLELIFFDFFKTLIVFINRTVTMWFNPRRSRKAIDILSGLAKLKLTNDEISVACPRAFAALLGI